MVAVRYYQKISICSKRTQSSSEKNHTNLKLTLFLIKKSLCKNFENDFRHETLFSPFSFKRHSLYFPVVNKELVKIYQKG